jgi:hypothetical protein
VRWRSRARSADDFSARISLRTPLTGCTVLLLMRGDGEASFMSARSFKIRHGARGLKKKCEHTCTIVC